MIFNTAVSWLLMSFALHGFLNGEMIGYSKYEYSDTYFIDNFFEMIFYIDFWQIMICFGIPLFFWAAIVNIYIIRGKQ